MNTQRVDNEHRMKVARLYKKRMPLILRYYPVSNASFFDWNILLTEIEREVWNSIQLRELPFYPQYPSLGYHIAFADPVKQIGIDVIDHTETGTNRHPVLENGGWRLYEIPIVDDANQAAEIAAVLNRIATSHYALPSPLTLL